MRARRTLQILRIATSGRLFSWRFGTARLWIVRCNVGGMDDRYRDQGLTLVEVMWAMALLVVLAAGASTMSLRAMEATRRARLQTVAVALAASKLEQLRALEWSFGDPDAPARSSDVVTDLSRDPAAAGGRGLSPSSGSALQANEPGYVDFADVHGRWVGAGVTPPPGAAFVRRWSVELDGTGSDALLLQVRVLPVSLASVSSSASRLPGEVSLMTMRMRKAG